MALTAEDKESATSGVAVAAVIIAFCAAVVGTARWGLNLGDAWAWAALFIGVFAVGMTAVRIVVGAGGTGISMMALGFAGAAIICPWVPLAPVISLAGLLLLIFGV